LGAGFLAGRGEKGGLVDGEMFIGRLNLSLDGSKE
jgi:hypothetical protein